MLKKIKYLLLAGLLYAIFITALFPARVAINTLKQQQLLPDHIDIRGVTGSVWSGNIARVAFKGIVIDDVQWGVSIPSLFLAKIHLDLTIGQQASDLQAQGKLVFNLDGFSVNDVHITAPIDYFNDIAPFPYGLTSSGNVAVNIKHFKHDTPWCDRLDANVKTSDLLIKSGMGQLPIDHLSIKLSCLQGALQGHVTPTTNSLGIDGNVALDKNNRYVVKATVVPPSTASQDYLNVLSFTGAKNRQGQYIFNYNGQL